MFQIIQLTWEMIGYFHSDLRRKLFVQYLSVLVHSTIYLPLVLVSYSWTSLPRVNTCDFKETSQGYRDRFKSVRPAQRGGKGRKCIVARAPLGPGLSWNWMGEKQVPIVYVVLRMIKSLTVNLFFVIYNSWQMTYLFFITKHWVNKEIWIGYI